MTEQFTTRYRRGGSCTLPQPLGQVSTIPGTHKGRPYDNVTYSIHIIVDSRFHGNDGWIMR